jgi:2-polyprenyl-3-methyl-5-hydroxy-6-metoxy-1,4-benzoquinol methylase
MDGPDRYQSERKQHEADHKRKLKWLGARLRPYMLSGVSILVVGAGQGWFLDHARSHSCEYFAIEPVAHLSASIESRGGHVIGGELSEDYQAYEATFDIVVVRHVLEHLLDPSSAL